MLLYLFNQKVIITLRKKNLSNMNDGKQSSRFNPTKITSNAIVWGRNRTKQKNFFFQQYMSIFFFLELFSCLVNVSIMFCPFQHPPYKHTELGLNTFCLDEYLLVYYMVTIYGYGRIVAAQLTNFLLQYCSDHSWCLSFFWHYPDRY